MFEFAGQDAPVELVELYQMDQVCELGRAIVKAKKDLAVLLKLPERERGENKKDFFII